MSKIIDWIKKHVWQTILIGFGLFFAPLILVHIAYRITAISPWFASTWEAGELITYIAGFEAFLGTVALGAVAIYQNSEANEMNKRLLENEEKRDAYERQPDIMISHSNIKQDVTRQLLNRIEVSYSPENYETAQDTVDNPSFHLVLQLMNISRSNACIKLQNFKVQDLSKPNLSLVFEKKSFSFEKSDFILATGQSKNLSFCIDKNRLYNRNPKLCVLVLRLFNSIGESFEEIITSIIQYRGDKPYIETISYYTKKIEETKNEDY